MAMQETDEMKIMQNLEWKDKFSRYWKNSHEPFE